MRYFDTHAHLGLVVSNPIEQIILVERAKAAGVLGILSVCNNLIDFFDLYKNLAKLSSVYFCAGVSPSEVTRIGKNWQQDLSKALALDKVIAVGETGLDYYRKYGDKKSQIELFIRQIEIANHVKKPIIIHNRESGDDILEILQTHKPQYGGILHCYGEDLSFSKKILKIFDNIMFSFAGNITFKTAKHLQEVAVQLPEDVLLVESESPFMTPAEYHNKRNTPAYVASTIKFLSDLRGKKVEDFSEILYKNACNFFNLEIV